MSKQGPVAVVTGAGSGIGRHIVRVLADAGYGVVLAGRRREALIETLSECCSPEDASLIVPTDVTDCDSVEHLFVRIRSKFGRLDLLVNNAAVPGTPGPLDELSFDNWQTAVDTNLTGYFLCAQQAFRLMKAQLPQGGRIINNGSIAAHTPRPFWVAYTATKHAVTGLTKAIGLEGRPYNIAVCQIDIGNARTDMTDAIASGVFQADGSIAGEPTIDAAHVARAVLYVANLPLDVNVPFLTVMATQMPYLGRG